MSAAAVSECDRFNPFVERYASDPYSLYARWRHEAPVHWGAPPDPAAPGCWYTLDYDSSKKALSDDRLGLEFQKLLPEDSVPPVPDGLQPFFNLIGKWMIFRDPPDHTRLRRFLAEEFTRTSVAQLTARIEGITQLLLSQLESDADLIRDFAFPLPVLVIGCILGIDTSQTAQLKRWSRQLLQGIDLKRADDAASAYAAAASAAVELSEFLKVELAARRRSPGQDALSRLSQIDNISEEEIIASCALLLFAGHETTVNLLGNGSLALLQNPDQCRLLVTHPELIGSAIEEMLRFDSPSQLTFRYALESFALGPVQLKVGDPVGIVIGAANRDPLQFPEPDTFDIQRTPNRHLSFGVGRHTCLGTALARTEARIGFEQLLKAFPRLQLASDSLVWAPSIGLRGLANLPVRILE